MPAPTIIDAATGYTRCNACLAFKPDAEMMPSHRLGGGVRPRCRECERAQQRTYQRNRALNPETRALEAAKFRALFTLAREYPEEYNAHVAEHLARTKRERAVGIVQVAAHERVVWAEPL